MDIRIILYIVIIGFGFFFIMRNQHGDRTRKLYIWIVMPLLLLESSLRNINVGPDTISYYYEFLSVQDESWRQIWQSFFNTYVLGEGKDAGFHFLIKGFQGFSTDFNAFLFFIGLVFFIPLACILYENTNNMWQLTFAFTLYVALFQIIAMSGIRQQIATGGCFIAYLLLSKRKYKLSFLLVVFSGLFHISSLIFLTIILFYLLCEKFSFRIAKVLHIVSFLLIPAMVVASRSFISFLASFLKNDYYMAYAEHDLLGGAETYFVLMELLSLFCFICISKEAIIREKSLRLMYLTIPMTTILTPLVMLDGSMIRLGQYFTLFMMMLFPKGIELSFRNSRGLLYIISIITLVCLSLRDTFNYSFFWQMQIPHY